MKLLHQGDIVRIEKINYPVLVVSKDFFNSSGEIIGCPLALLDMSVRGYKKTGCLPIDELINISDAIQGIFEYI